MSEERIKVRCRTAIDDFRNDLWPTEMACRPLKGDAVRARDGAVLHVVNITHMEVNSKHQDMGQCDGRSIKYDPILEIELHKYYPGLDSCVVRAAE